MNLPLGGAEHEHAAASASDMRSAMRAARIAGAIHLVLWLLAASVIAGTQRQSLGALVGSGGSPLLLVLAATLLSFAGLLALTRPLLVADSMLGGVLILVLPPLASVGALELLITQAMAAAAAAGSSAEVAVRTTSTLGRAMTVQAVGAAGSALVASFLACLVTLRVRQRAVATRPGSIAWLAFAIAAAGAIAMTLKLRLPSPLLLGGPLTVAVAVIAVTASALEGHFDPRDPRAAPRAALDALSAILLALCAVGLGALACGAAYTGDKLGSVGSGALDAALAATQRGWTDGVLLIRRAALAGLPILGAAAVLLAANAARVGTGARVWGIQSAVVAVATLGIVAGLRGELTRAGVAAAKSWSFRGYPNTYLARLAASGAQRAAPAVVERALVIGASHILQRKTDLGSVTQLDTDFGCSAVATRIQLDASVPLSIAADVSVPFRRIGCLLRAIAALPSGGDARCNVVLLGVPSKQAASYAVPPFDDIEPFPVAVPARIAEAACQEAPPKSLSLEPTAHASEVITAAAAELARGGEVFLSAVQQDGAPPSPAADPPAASAQPESSADPPGASAQAAASSAPAASGDPRVDFDPVTVRGNMFATDVQPRFQALRAEFVACAKRAPNDALDHKLVFEFVIGEGGGVIYVAPNTKTDLPEAIRSCMQMVLYHIGFPSPKKGTARVFAPIHVHR